MVYYRFESGTSDKRSALREMDNVLRPTQWVLAQQHDSRGASVGGAIERVDVLAHALVDCKAEANARSVTSAARVLFRVQHHREFRQG
jgi:hypothetical protein